MVVRDEVWARLDPHAGRLSRRSTVRLWLGGSVLAVLAAVGVLVAHSGVIVAQLYWVPEAGSASGGGPDLPPYLEFTVANLGRVPVTVVGAGRSGPGLELIDAAGPFPVTLAPGDTMLVRLTYRITDCDGVPRGWWPVPLRVDRWWGEQTTEVTAGYDWPHMLAGMACETTTP
jgi:hypothetical protein